MVQLVMKAAQSVLGGTREVVLDKLVGDAEFGKSGAVIGLNEKTARIPEYLAGRSSKTPGRDVSSCCKKLNPY